MNIPIECSAFYERKASTRIQQCVVRVSLMAALYSLALVSTISSCFTSGSKVNNVAQTKLLAYVCRLFLSNLL